MDAEIRLTANGDALVGAVNTGTKAIDAQTDSLAALRTEADKTNQRLRDLSTAFQLQQKGVAANADATGALDDELASFMSKLSPAYNAVKQLDTGHDLLTRSMAAGLLTQKQYDDALTRLTTKYGPAAAASKALADSHVGQATQAAFAARETRALFDELASGRDRQAIGTLTLLATRVGGVGMAGLAAAAGVAAILGLLALGIEHAESTSRAMNQVEAEFTATGRAGLLSTGQVKGLVDQLALLPDMSRAGAQQTIAALSSVPTITGPLLQQLAAIVDDFAYSTGQKTPQAAQLLARALEDPLKGAQALDKQFNLLTADQELQIESLTRQGKTYDAQQILLKALQDRFTGLHDNALTPMQKATSDLGNAWDRLWKSIGDSSVITGASNLVTGLITKVSQFVDLVDKHPSVMLALYGPLGAAEAVLPSSIPEQSGGASASWGGPQATPSGPSWDQQQQSYVSGLNAEVKAALDAGKAYGTTADQMQRLRDLRQQLQGAQIAAALAGDTAAVKELGKELRGVNKALNASHMADFTSTQSYIANSNDEADIYESQQNAAATQFQLDTRLQARQASISTTADPNARGQQQLDLERTQMQQRLDDIKVDSDKRQAMQDDLDNWYVARQAQLNEQLKPQYEKNLDAWGNMTQSMRDSYNSLQLATQAAGEQITMTFAETGQLSGSAMVKAFEDEIAKSIYRKYFAQGVSDITGGIANFFPTLFPSSGGGDLSKLFANTDPSVGHTGGVLGTDSLPTRSVPALTFANAPRFHTGVGPGEVAAIIRDDEGVFTPGQMRALAPVSSQPPSVTVNMNNQSGQQLDVQASPPRVDGGKVILDVVLKRLQRDRGSRDALTNMLSPPR